MLIDRLPPQDINTEQSILASCLLDPEALNTALNILQPSDFYKKAHKNIFKTFQYLVRKHRAVDLTTVAACLLEFKKLSEIGGAVYLSELVNECPLSVNIEHYSEAIKAKSVLRKLIYIQSKNIEACYEAVADNIPKILDDIQSSILSIEMNGHKDNFINMADLTAQSYERYETLQAGRGDKAVKTGFPTIDTLTGGGFRGSKLVIIAARPGIGKTSMLTTMSKNMSTNGHTVGIFSIEMDKEEIDDRFTAAETGINSLKLSSGKHLNADDWININEAAGIKSTWPIFIDDTGGLTVLELKRRVRNMKKAGVGIVFIDQLSQIRSGIKGSLYEQNTHILKELAALKKELRMPVVLLVQINRKIGERKDKKPTLFDLKSTGAIEEDADIVLLIHREYAYSKKEYEKYDGEVEIAKQRGGPCRNILLNWSPKTTTFTEKTERG